LITALAGIQKQARTTEKVAWQNSLEVEVLLYSHLGICHQRTSSHFQFMFGQKAFSLLEEIDRSEHTIPPYRDALVREVCDEVNELCKSLPQVGESASEGDQVRVMSRFTFILTFK
jgi:hypothetical protein